VLEAWEERRGAPRPLSDVFEEHLARLRASTREAWHVEVTGKAVLKVFLTMLIRAARKPTLQHELLCSMYLAQQPEPHQDLRDIVDAILVLPSLGG
jgi:hypothetical protein